MPKSFYIAQSLSAASQSLPANHFNQDENQAPVVDTKKAVVETSLVTILDWDDTLFPTHDMYKKPCDLSLEQLFNHGQMMHAVLSRYVQLCGHQNVYIVTNGVRGWVQKSLLHLCHRYNSKLAQALQQQSQSHIPDAMRTNYFEMVFHLLFNQAFGFPITVCSARYFYETQIGCKHSSTAGAETIKWKVFTFQTIFQQRLQRARLTSDGIHLQILCIGDGNDEYVASLKTKLWLQAQPIFKQAKSSVKCHRLKLQRNPSISNMYSQFQAMYWDVPQCFNMASGSSC